MSQTRTFMTSDGVRLAYVVDDFTERWKPIETVVLLHAAMSSLKRFYAWVPLLARQLRVVRIDMRGHGDSETPPLDRDLSMDRFAQDVIELLDRLALGRVHLSGSSGGGYIAQWLAINQPQRVGKLALFSSTPGLRYARPEMHVEQWPIIVRAKGVDGLLGDTVAARVDPSQVDAGFIRWMVEEAKGMDREFTARVLAMMARLDLGPRLHDIAAPTLIVVPGADTVCGPEGYEVLRRIPNHRWVVYEGVPHNITNAMPERCATELREFLLGAQD